jgi:hypothetical protein
VANLFAFERKKSPQAAKRTIRDKKLKLRRLTILDGWRFFMFPLGLSSIETFIIKNGRRKETLSADISIFEMQDV